MLGGLLKNTVRAGSGRPGARVRVWVMDKGELCREASWSAVAKGQGASLCPDDTAVERRKNAPRPKNTVRHATAVSRLSACHRIDSLRSPFGQHFVRSIYASLRFHDAAANLDDQ
jgi:hypothetical protein